MILESESRENFTTVGKSLSDFYRGLQGNILGSFVKHILIQNTNELKL